MCVLRNLGEGMRDSITIKLSSGWPDILKNLENQEIQQHWKKSVKYQGTLIKTLGSQGILIET